MTGDLRLGGFHGLPGAGGSGQWSRRRGRLRLGALGQMLTQLGQMLSQAGSVGAARSTTTWPSRSRVQQLGTVGLAEHRAAARRSPTRCGSPSCGWTQATTLPDRRDDGPGVVAARLGGGDPAHLAAAVRPGRPAGVRRVGAGAARRGAAGGRADGGDARPDGRAGVRLAARAGARASSAPRC